MFSRIETLKQRFSSRGAGDQRANPVLSGISAPFRSAATALMLGSTIALSALPANAQDAQVQRVASNTAQPVSLMVTDNRILPDAHRPANVWAVQNPNGVAVSLSLGSDRSIPLDTIEQVFKSDFAGQGITEVAFFYEEDKSLPGTGVAFHTDEYVYGPYTLVEARKAIPTDVSQMKFNNASYKLER